MQNCAECYNRYNSAFHNIGYMAKMFACNKELQKPKSHPPCRMSYYFKVKISTIDFNAFIESLINNFFFKFHAWYHPSRSTYRLNSRIVDRHGYHS